MELADAMAASGRAGYAAAVVDVLVRVKRQGGRRFELAWAVAMAECPPGGMWLGPSRLELIGRDEFSRCESPLVFLERVCRDAWEGAPAPDLSVSDLRDLMGDTDESTGARRHGRRGGYAVLA